MNLCNYDVCIAWVQSSFWQKSTFLFLFCLIADSARPAASSPIYICPNWKMYLLELKTYLSKLPIVFAWGVRFFLAQIYLSLSLKDVSSLTQPDPLLVPHKRWRKSHIKHFSFAKCICLVWNIYLSKLQLSEEITHKTLFFLPAADQHGSARELRFI